MVQREGAAVHVRVALSSRATDAAIVAHALATNAVIVTKDADFLSMVASPPPHLVHVRLGNAVNARLIAAFERDWGAAERALNAGAAVVEIG